MNLIQTLQKITKQKIILPFYHTVSEIPLLHINNLYRMKTVSEFLKDLNFLLKNFEPVGIDTLYHLIIYNIAPPKPVFHLTFDDGLKEMYEVIAPVLLQKGVPATFFINSGFVDNKALFYRHHASLAINNLQKEEKTSPKLKTDILSCSYHNKEKLFQYFSQQQVNDFLNKEKPYLTTEQIQALNKQGFTFGAHSIDHPYYCDISLAEQLRQTRESIDFVSFITNQKWRLFAFPFTDFNVSANFFEEVKPNIDLCFGTAGLKKSMIPFHLQRVAAERKNYASLASILKKEYVKSFFTSSQSF